jgi:hypothetical protein
MIRTAKQFALWTSSLFIAAISAFAQDPTPIASALQVQVQAPEVTYFQLQRYLMKRISTPLLPGGQRSGTLRGRNCASTFSKTLFTMAGHKTG